MYLIAHIGHTNKSHEHVMWWKPASRGYTICLEKAGRYSAEEAEKICQNGSCIAVLEKDAEPLARSTPYYRRKDGTLGRMYDGGPHRPIPNSRQCWNTLMKSRQYPPQGHEVERPAPIGSKASAIYIDDVTVEEA